MACGKFRGHRGRSNPGGDRSEMQAEFLATLRVVSKWVGSERKGERAWPGSRLTVKRSLSHSQKLEDAWAHRGREALMGDQEAPTKKLGGNPEDNGVT